MSTGKLSDVKVGDSVFVGVHGQTLRAAKVEKVGKIHITAAGKKYAISDGVLAGDQGIGGYGYTRAHVETPARREAFDLYTVKWSFEKELGEFRADPKRMTKDRLLELLRVMNPEAWA